MKPLQNSHLYTLTLLSLMLCGCDFDDDAVMSPSSWASIFVVAAVLLFFYYIFKMLRRKK
ncbi:hypothetical protein ACFSRY_19005 [Pontibacter locisalis]|uniref:Uncharacterized protein n=1 Tax=Pontibacter locisalis TaxID=1719035 RepID=A0ABW5IQN4_9BACT